MSAVMMFILQVASCVMASVAAPSNRTSCWADGSCQPDDEVALVQSRLDLKRAQADHTSPPEDCIPCSKCTLNGDQASPRNHMSRTYRDWEAKCMGDHVCSWTKRSETFFDEGTCADAPLPQLCAPCGKCTTTGTLLPSDTIGGYRSSCENTAGCVLRNDAPPQNPLPARIAFPLTGSCQEVWDTDTTPAGTRAFIFDFDETISTTHMYSLLTENARDYREQASNNGKIHPYASPDGVFQVDHQSKAYIALRFDQYHLTEGPQTEETKELQEGVAEELQRMKEDKTSEVQNYVQEQFEKTEHAWTDQDVKDRILGGDDRIGKLKGAFQAAHNAGWELFVLSFGVQAEINQVLEIAGLDGLLPKDHVFGRKITRTKRNLLFPTDMTKAEFIHENIRADLPVLFDDDNQNIKGCDNMGYCKGVFVEDGLKPKTLQHFASLPVGDETAPW